MELNAFCDMVLEYVHFLEALTTTHYQIVFFTYTEVPGCPNISQFNPQFVYDLGYGGHKDLKNIEYTYGCIIWQVITILVSRDIIKG